jgi:hypothetical protein
METNSRGNDGSADELSGFGCGHLDFPSTTRCFCGFLLCIDGRGFRSFSSFTVSDQLSAFCYAFSQRRLATKSGDKCKLSFNLQFRRLAIPLRLARLPPMAILSFVPSQAEDGEAKRKVRQSVSGLRRCRSLPRQERNTAVASRFCAITRTMLRLSCVE